MSLKGNLLFNGDFETGTTEGWVTGAFGKTFEFDFSASAEAKYRGNYGGLLYAPIDFANGFLAYNKTCSFEEYEAYLMIMYVNMVSGFYTTGRLYGLDDKGNLIEDFLLGYNTEANTWRRFIALLRGFRDITHFQVGLYAWCSAVGSKVYIDEAKLIPLRSVKGHEIAEYRYFDNVTADKRWYSVIGCIGRCKLRSIVRTADVSGTSPTLDIILKIWLLDNTGTYYTLTHTQFTGAGFEEKIIDLPEVSAISIDYTLGGTNPSFDIYHHLRIEPY